MRKLFALASAIIMFSLVLNSCDKDKDDVFSVIGTWRVSGVDYYYDNNLLAFHDTVIGIWLSPQPSDASFMVSHGGLVFNQDGTGKLFGMGEFGTDESDFTYKQNQDRITISIQFPNGRTVNGELEIRDSKLVMIQTESDIYGWSPDKADSPSGADGSSSHTLKSEVFYSR